MGASSRLWTSGRWRTPLSKTSKSRAVSPRIRPGAVEHQDINANDVDADAKGRLLARLDGQRGGRHEQQRGELCTHRH